MCTENAAFHTEENFWFLSYATVKFYVIFN